MVLGIDIGGSGIKGALVDIIEGKLVTDVHRIETPENSSPQKIAEVIEEIRKFFNYEGIIGCGFPSVVINGVIKTAANIDKSNININAEKLFSDVTGQRVFVVNDADAAGKAEINFGAGKSKKGVVIVLTIGTGIGSAFFVDGKLFPNSEFGHILMDKDLIAEKFTSDTIRKLENLNWKEWGQRFNIYLNYLDRLLNPELIIIGGGVSKKMDNFIEVIELKTKIVPAALLNTAGIAGAALFASEKYLIL